MLIITLVLIEYVSCSPRNLLPGSTFNLLEINDIFEAKGLGVFPNGDAAVAFNQFDSVSSLKHAVIARVTRTGSIIWAK